MSGEKEFWNGMTPRVGAKRTDKVMIGNVDDNGTNFEDRSELLKPLVKDDFPESITEPIAAAQKKADDAIPGSDKTDNPNDSDETLVVTVKGVKKVSAEINSLKNSGYISAGNVAPTSTPPSSITNNIFYIVDTEGTYTNFKDSSNNPIVFSSGEFGYIRYQVSLGYWKKTVWDVAKKTYVDDIHESLLVLLDDKASLQFSVNAFNKNSEYVNPSHYVNASDGVHTVNEDFTASGKIPIPDGETQVLLSYSGQCAFLDESEDYISGNVGGGALNDLVTIPSGAKFIDTSISNSSGGIDTFMLIFGTEIPAKYVPYKIVQRDLLQITNNEIVEPLKKENIADEAIINEKVKKNSLQSDRMDFMTESPNIFDENDSDIVKGKYLNSSGDPDSVNASYNTSGFINISSIANGEPIYGQSAEDGNVFRFYAFFDKDKNYITGSRVANELYVNYVSKFNDAIYFRHCYPNSNTEIMISLSPIEFYESFGNSLQNEYLKNTDINRKVNTLLGNNASIASFSGVSNGEEKTLDNFPYHLKKGLSMSISCEFTSFTGNIEFGKGREETNGDWLRIDDTNIYWYGKGSTTTVRGTYAHGLTISTYINASLSINYLGEFYVTLQTLGGSASTTFGTRNEANYQPFIYTIGQDLTNVTLTATSKEFQHPVWVFCDSYGGVVDNRWPGQMRNIGYFNFLLNGLSGQVSSLAYADLLRCLKYGTPKYLLWCLGMNDTDLGYENVLDDLIELCDRNNITLILATIPTVPTRDKETIKTIVESSGYRYVDFYKAVGTDAAGSWYSGYLDVDNVHPKDLGAKALASQILVDFPELMQYGIIN